MDAMSSDHAELNTSNDGVVENGLSGEAIDNEWMNGESIEGDGDHLMQNLLVSTSRYKQSNIGKRSVAGPSADRKGR